MTYNIEDIEVGNEVTWRSNNPDQSDFDECWEVTGKKGNEVYIRLYYMGREYFWTLNINEVVTLIPKKL